MEKELFRGLLARFPSFIRPIERSSTLTQTPPVRKFVFPLLHAALLRG